MSDSIDSAKVLRDIPLLYELSLAVGNSLDLKTNCDIFLKTMMARKNLAYASVWIKDEYLPDQEKPGWATLVYANPEHQIQQNHLPLHHPQFSLLEKKTAYSVAASDSNFSDIIVEKDITKGAFATFALGEIGILKLFSSSMDKSFEQLELNQLGNVIAKFTISLAGCLSHQKVTRETAERKRAEMALRQAKMVIESSPTVLFRWKTAPGWPVEYVSENIVQFGYTPQELLSGAVPFTSIVHPDDLERVAREVQHYIESQADRFTQEYRLILKDGRIIWTFDQTTIERDTQGNVTYFHGTVQDITERKQAESERARLLAEVEATYRQYVRQEWQQFLGEQPEGWRVVHQPTNLPPTLALDSLTNLEAEVLREGKTKVAAGLRDNGHSRETAIVAPLSLRGEVIGALSLQDIDPERQWSAEEIALVETVAEQLALTIENLRLFDDTQKQATREKVIADITSQVWASGDLERVMRTAVEKIGATLDASKVVIRLGTEDQLLAQ
jgi:PAS domain S-box-containing protein